jgi:PadR family transcriptional regulator, regulatory protein AphA
MLKYILLGFLKYQPLTGYDLKRIMDESTMHFWHAYHSQIYTTLRKLEDDGLLTSEEVEADPAEGQTLTRRVYHITDAGQRDFQAWLAKDLDSTPQVKEDLLVRMFFSGKRDKSAVLNELRFQRQLHQRQLDHYNRLTSDHLTSLVTPDNVREIPFWTATLSFGKQYEVMYLNWLDEVIAQIENLA